MRRQSFIALWAIAALACSNNSAPDDDAGMERMADIDAATPADSGHDIGPDTEPVQCPTGNVGSLWGRVYDQETFNPLAGVGVCVLNQPSLGCATSNADGIYQITCVPAGDAELEYRAAGYPRQLWAWTSRDNWDEDVNLGLLPESNYAEFLAPSGQAFPDATRSLVTMYFVGDGTVDGARVALSQGTGSGPYYTRYEGGTLDPSITSITSLHENAYLFAQAPSGSDEIEITVTPGPGASSCTQYYGGWVGATPNSIRVPVEPGAISVVFIRCQ